MALKTLKLGNILFWNNFFKSLLLVIAYNFNYKKNYFLFFTQSTITASKPQLESWKIYQSLRTRLDKNFTKPNIFSKNPVLLKNNKFLYLKSFKNNLFWRGWFKLGSFFLPVKYRTNFSAKTSLFNILNPHVGLANTQASFNKWKKALNLIQNLLFFDIQIFFFTSFIFSKESALLNRELTSSNFFKKNLLEPSYFFSSLAYSSISNIIYQRYLNNYLAITVILNSTVHKHLTSLLKKNNSFIIGISSSESSPWTFSYPVPILTNSFVTQSFFLNLTLSMIKVTNFLKKTNSLRIWSQILNL